MTLVLSVQTKNSIWLATDRRLSAVGVKPFDKAIKATIVEVTGGIALLGYAGLGATARGNQPSQWVSNVLRGRHHQLEDMLKVVADAMRREFLHHLDKKEKSRVRRHSFVIPALLDDKPRLYTIDLVRTAKSDHFRYTRHIMGGALTPLQVTMPIGLAGSGAAVLRRRMNWVRQLLSLVNAYNRKKVSGHTVAERFAQLVDFSHKMTTDGSVGPECLVIWRNTREGLLKGGGAHEFYTNAQRSPAFTNIPSIVMGIDMSAFTAVLMAETGPVLEEQVEALRRGKTPGKFDHREEAIKRRVSQLPSKPDEKLR